VGDHGIVEAPLNTRRFHAALPTHAPDWQIDQVSSEMSPPLVYCAFIQVFDPTSLTDTSEKKTRSGWPSPVPR